MHTVSISKYARFKKVSRQAIQDRIRRGTLATVDKTVKVKMVPVSDIEYEEIKQLALASANSKE